MQTLVPPFDFRESTHVILPFVAMTAAPYSLARTFDAGRGFARLALVPCPLASARPSPMQKAAT